MARPSRPSPATSTAAKGLDQFGVIRDMVSEQSGKYGVRVSRPVFYRGIGATEDAPPPYNAPLLQFFFGLMADEASEETSPRHRQVHAAACRLWKQLLVHHEFGDLQGRRATAAAILETLPAVHASPLVALVRGQGSLHAALALGADTDMRHGWHQELPVVDLLGHAEVLLRCDVVDPLQDHYKDLQVAEFLQRTAKDEDGKQRHDVRDVPNADCMGVILSTAMHSQLYIARHVDAARWKEVVEEFAENGVLPHLLVRGVVFRQSMPMLNAAEAFHGLGWITEAQLTLRYLVTHIRRDPGRLLDSSLDPSVAFDPVFVAWALAYLASIIPINHDPS